MNSFKTYEDAIDVLRSEAQRIHDQSKKAEKKATLESSGHMLILVADFLKNLKKENSKK